MNDQYLLSSLREALLVEGVHQDYLIVYQGRTDGRAVEKSIDSQEKIHERGIILSQGPTLSFLGGIYECKDWLRESLGGSQHASSDWDQFKVLHVSLVKSTLGVYVFICPIDQRKGQNKSWHGDTE